MLQKMSTLQILLQYPLCKLSLQFISYNYHKVFKVGLNKLDSIRMVDNLCLTFSMALLPNFGWRPTFNKRKGEKRHVRTKANKSSISLSFLKVH